MRDSLSAFDQVRAFAGDTLTIDDVTAVLGLVGRDLVFDVLDAVAGEDAAAAFALVETAIERGYDLRILCRELARATRDLLLVSVDAARLKDPDVAGESERPRLTAIGARYSREDLLRAFDAFTRAEFDVRQSDHPRFQLEMALVRLMHLRKLVPLAELLDGGGARPSAPLSRSVPAAASRPGLPPPRSAAQRGAPASRRGPPRPRPRRCRRPPPRPRRQVRRPRPWATATARPRALPGRHQGGQAVLLQRGRRPGLSHRGDTGAHHLRVPGQSEGAAGAVRGEPRVARRRWPPARSGSEVPVQVTTVAPAEPAARSRRRRRRRRPPRARRRRPATDDELRQRGALRPWRAGAVRDLPGGTHQDRGDVGRRRASRSARRAHRTIPQAARRGGQERPAPGVPRAEDAARGDRAAVRRHPRTSRTASPTARCATTSPTSTRAATAPTRPATSGSSAWWRSRRTST